MNNLLSLYHENSFLFKYTIIPLIPLILISILSIDPLLWVSSEVHHFYIELFAVVFGLILSFYYLLRARTIHDIFSLFIGLGFLVSAIIDLMHVIISFYAISDPIFIKYFIPQTWFAGRIFLSSLLCIAIIKYSKISKGIDESYQSDDKFQEENLGRKEQRKFLFYLVGLGIFTFGIALTSLYFIFPASVIDEYSLHRPYEIPPLILFLIALFFFYKQKLYKKKDLLYKGLAIYLILDIFSQIIMSYSTISFDTAHNMAHVLKDAAYFVNIIALSLSSIQINVELRKSNRLVILQNKKLEETGKMQKEFINIAAHELRTPIQPILGLSGLLINHNIKGTENNKIAEVIYRNALKLQHIAEDILDVTKIESQSLSLNKEKFDLDELISNTIADFENSSNYKSENLSKSVKIIYKSKGLFNKHNPIIVEADKMRISQVLSNLLSNASKSSNCIDDRKTKFIYVDMERQQNEREKVHYKRISNQNINQTKNEKTSAIVSIKDEGIGIRQELRSRLYEKFTTDSQGGTGLGLFICKNIIESHEGELWFEDNKDRKGVTFYFTLPTSNEMSIKSFQNNIRILESRWKKNSIIETNKSLLSHDQINIKKGNQNCNILLVDDDEDVNITLKKILEERGYNVYAFSNSIEALKSFRKNFYNVIILDIKMPRMNGFEFYNKIREIDDKVKICFLTAGEPNTYDHFGTINKNICLRKPIENEELLKTISNILE